jgi:hypothetical protein
VNVDFNLHGRAWKNPEGETRYFNTLAVWKIASSATSDITPDAVEGDLPFILTLLISSTFLLQSLPF